MLRHIRTAKNQANVITAVGKIERLLEFAKSVKRMPRQTEMLVTESTHKRTVIASFGRLQIWDKNEVRSPDKVVLRAGLGFVSLKLERSAKAASLGTRLAYQ